MATVSVRRNIPTKIYNRNTRGYVETTEEITVTVEAPTIPEAYVQAILGFDEGQKAVINHFKTYSNNQGQKEDPANSPWSKW